MAVPNTTTFNLQNVTTAVHGDTAAARNLSSAFSASIDPAFNATYKGSKNQLYNFRDYNSSRIDGKYMLGSSWSYFYCRSGDYGASWAATNSISGQKSDWGWGGISNSGQYILLTSWTGSYNGFHVSTDYGVTWTNVRNSQGFIGGMVSGSGRVMHAITSNGGWGNVSTNDYGATWNESGLSITARGNGCMSDSGQYVYARNTSYQMVRSADYGANFSVLSGIGCSGDYGKSAISATGQYVMLPTWNGCYVSSNYGASFTRKDFLFDSWRFGDIAWTPWGGAVSGDGKYMIIPMYGLMDQNTGQDIVPFYSYKSSDYGATWSVMDYGYPYTHRGAALSYDGKYQIIGRTGSVTEFSSNYGASWTVKASSPYGSTDLIMNRMP